MEENKFDETTVTFEATETPDVSADTQPSPTPQPQDCECKKENKCRCLPIINIIMLIGLVLIYIFHFAGIGVNNSKSLVNADAKEPVAFSDNSLKIAYINTDSLMDQYKYAKDLEKQLETFRTAKENSYKQQMEQFQKDYQNYLKSGDQLTLTQQQAKEKELQERAARLQTLEGEFTQQIQEKTLNESKKMTDAVYNFIREYNAQNQQFDLIFARSYSSSPILYGNEGMDITKEIIKGLNEEYERVKAEKK